MSESPPDERWLKYLGQWHEEERITDDAYTTLRDLVTSAIDQAANEARYGRD